MKLSEFSEFGVQSFQETLDTKFWTREFLLRTLFINFWTLNFQMALAIQLSNIFLWAFQNSHSALNLSGDLKGLYAFHWTF